MLWCGISGPGSDVMCVTAQCWRPLLMAPYGYRWSSPTQRRGVSTVQNCATLIGDGRRRSAIVIVSRRRCLSDITGTQLNSTSRRESVHDVRRRWVPVLATCVSFCSHITTGHRGLFGSTLTRTTDRDRQVCIPGVSTNTLELSAKLYSVAAFKRRLKTTMTPLTLTVELRRCIRSIVLYCIQICRQA